MSELKTLKEITKTIEISPKFLNSKILETVVFTVKKKYENMCDEENGLLVSIENIIKITNIISLDSKSVIFSVTFMAVFIKPKIGLKVSFDPMIILNKGVFGKLHDNIKFFIPENCMEGWTFVQDCGHFVKKGRKPKYIKKGEEVGAIITDVKFDSTKYNCVCTLKF